MSLEVANTIAQQLGGGRFLAMTGAKNLIGSADALSFRLPGARGFTKNGINAVRVQLTPADDYTVTFSRVRGAKVVEVVKVEGVYCDMLQDVFCEQTGLFTHL